MTVQNASLYWYMTWAHRTYRTYRYNRAFRHVHENRAAICRWLDMRLNPLPNLGPNLMIVYVLEKLKMLESMLFVLIWY